MRLIPGRVASSWGQPTIPEVGELEKVIYCSEESLRRVRRKLGNDGDGAIYVRMKKVGEKSFNVKQKEEEEGKEDGEKGDMGLEGWLAAWVEVPDGCCVVAGQTEDWSKWAAVRSANLVSTLAKLINQIIQRHTPSRSIKRVQAQRACPTRTVSRLSRLSLVSADHQSTFSSSNSSARTR